MKKQSLLFLIILFAFKLSAQNCNFTYSVNPGTNLVSFSPNSAFSPNIYSFAWDFGDGNTSTQAFPVHAYNIPLPAYVCYTIYDSIGNPICSACDTVGYFVSNTCQFTILNSGTNFVTCQNTNPSSTSYSIWDMGDGVTLFGDVVTYTYQMPGLYYVCLSSIDSLTGSLLCSSCQYVTIQGGGALCTYIVNSNPATNIFDFTANVHPSSIVFWDFGDGTTGAGVQVSHSYAVPGNYYACMTVTDTSGVTCSYCDWVSSGSTHGNCYYTYQPDSMNPSAFTFFSSPAYPNTSVTWDFGDNTTGTGSVVNHVYSAPGNYLACMTETDSSGSIVCSYCDMVYVGSNTSCYYGYIVNPLNPMTVDFSAVTNGMFNTITWDFGDGTTATGPNPSHTYTNSGTYIVCISVGSGGAITCTFCDWVTVGNPSGNCVINFFPDSINANGFDFYLQPSSSGSNIVWDFGDGNIGTGINVNHVYSVAGTYQVCAVERDSAQNVTCQTCVIVTVGVPVNCQASFFASTLGLDAYFIDLSLGNPSSTTYNWDFGDGSSSTSRFPQHTYSSPGIYTACLTINTGSCIDQFCSPVRVDTTFGNPSGGCQAFFAIVQLAPYQVSVVNLSSGLNLNFLWDFGDGTTDNTPYPSHFYQNTGNYNLCLTVTDATGCTSSYCDTLSVDSLGNVFRSTPGFTLNILSPMSLTGVNEINDVQSFSVYPNPVQSELHINLHGATQKAIGYRLLTIQGSDVLSGKLNGLEGIVSVENISKGTYLLEVTFADGSRSYQNVIKY